MYLESLEWVSYKILCTFMPLFFFRSCPLLSSIWVMILKQLSFRCLSDMIKSHCIEKAFLFSPFCVCYRHNSKVNRRERGRTKSPSPKKEAYQRRHAPGYTRWVERPTDQFQSLRARVQEWVGTRAGGHATSPFCPNQLFKLFMSTFNSPSHLHGRHI